MDMVDLTDGCSSTRETLLTSFITSAKTSRSNFDLMSITVLRYLFSQSNLRRTVKIYKTFYKIF